MAPQSSIPVAATVLGTIGTILWCIQLIPQIWTNWRTKSTDGLPGSMMFLWAMCGVPFGAYSIVQNFNVPIQVQPQCFMALCLVSWAQILVYGHRWRVWTATLLGVAVGAACAGVEAALILTIRPIYLAGNDTPVFLAMDWNGAFFSLMALVAQNTFDVLGGVLYIICVILELGIFTSHFIWLIRTYKIRKQAKEQGKTFDEVALEHEQQGIPFKFAERKSRKWRRDRSKDAEEGIVAEDPGEELVQTAAGGESSADDAPEHGAGQSGKGIREKDP
ncbi:hypothetical protein Daus18300_002904 [Diaporthe australafricana]|uniref:PQ loop repeat protein n=1 Tax=Diaporthe australafricana TaxID=127596 RepID=A0ABR3XJY9_9PEZI